MKILLPTFISILKRQLHKMVKHTQTIRQFLPKNCLSVFDHYVGLALKGLNPLINIGVYIFRKLIYIIQKDL